MSNSTEVTLEKIRKLVNTIPLVELDLEEASSSGNYDDAANHGYDAGYSALADEIKQLLK